jgi:DNA invertase Pin-like site-specific DNA recombinase
VVVSKFDRLARATQHLLDIANLVKRKGTDLHILNLNIETSSATGKLLLTMIAAVATFEGKLMLETQREGIAKRKRRGNTRDENPQHGHGLLRSTRWRPMECARAACLGLVEELCGGPL